MYAFQQINGLLPPATIKAGFVSISAAHAYAEGWLAASGYETIAAEADEIEGGFDYMMLRGGDLVQFAINRVR